MQLTKNISITKGVAILFMLLIHLFCTEDYRGLFTPLIMIKCIPLALLPNIIRILLCSNLLFFQWLCTYVYI